MADNWDEGKHPRDNDGKFTSKGGKTSAQRLKEILEKRKGSIASSEEKAYNKSGKKDSKEDTSTFALNDPDSLEVYNNINSGKLYEIEDLKKQTAVKKIEEGIARFNDKYGDTSKDNSPRRQLLRLRWKQNFLSGKGVDTMPPGGGPLKKENKATIVVGLPAAGKSTKIVNSLSDEQGAFIMDSDEMKKLIPEFRESNGGAANAVHEESKQLMKQAFNEFINGSMRGTNVVIPVIGDDSEGLNKKYIRDLLAAGYNIEIAYKSADAKQSANRVIARAIKTGRFIPMSVVEKYSDEAVRKAYNEVLNTDYNGKRVRRSKYSEV